MNNELASKAQQDYLYHNLYPFPQGLVPSTLTVSKASEIITKIDRIRWLKTERMKEETQLKNLVSVYN